MTAFTYRDGKLFAEGLDLESIAEEVGTPFYCYSSSAIEKTYDDFQAALSGLDAKVFYALKANSNQAVIKTLAKKGAGADVVSEGELKRALAAGVEPGKIIFAGVGKSARELSFALETGILQINVESLPELERLNALALAGGRPAPVALRINPDVDPLTHKGISTGLADNKFGIDIGVAREIAGRISDYPGIELLGLAVHIGSLLTHMKPCLEAFKRVADLYREFRSLGIGLKRLDLGGGLGISYRDEKVPSLEDYAAVVREATEGLGAELAFEPGRRLVAEAGLLVSRVEYVKQGSTRQFIILDAAMNDLIRPMLYDAWHNIIAVKEPASGAEWRPADVVGPVCESTDTFTQERLLPPLSQGDLIAICSTGAYGAVMSSTYNSRPFVPEVMVKGDRYAVVRPRQDFEDLIEQDRLPSWLE